MKRLTRKTAVVTGASSGIGAATAARIAMEGAAALLLSGRDAVRLTDVANLCQRAGAQVHVHIGELANEADLNALAAAATSTFGNVDILVHSAGVFESGSVESTSSAEFERQWRINTWAPYALTHALLPGLIAARGQIVFVNSGAGATALPNCSAYCASKFALRAVADSLRQELAPHGVRVMSAMLGKIATPMQERIQTTRTGSYDPSLYPSPQDAADLIVAALALPINAEVTEFSLRPQFEGPR